jgi:dipeptidyl aminopeptidase/acylaminoacyl peptidase
VPDARYPLLFDKGDGLLFFPDNQGGSGPGDRDPYVSSVWYRDLTTGTERRLAQFTDGDSGPLHLAASPNGNRAAFSVGDESRLQWDIWVSSVHGTARQVPHDGQSLYPSFSPDGRTIAYTHQDGPDGCSTEVRLMDVDGADQRTLAAGSCERSLIRPVWLDRETIVAWQWTGDDTGYRPSALVAVSRATGDVRTIVGGRVFDFSVSRTLELVAFRVVDGRIGIWDPDTGDVVTVAGGTARQGGHLHVDGSLEQAV